MSVQNLHNFDHWNHAVHAVCGRFITQRCQHTERFIGDIRHHQLGDLNLADIQVNAPSIRRERGSASRGDDRFYFLVLQREGSMAINRSARTFTLHPGDMALLDSAEAFEMQPQGLIAQLSIHLCRDAVDRLLPTQACRFGKLEQAGLSGRLLHGMLQQISAGEMNLPTGHSHGAALQDALISLLQPSLRPDDVPDTGRPLRRLAERLINQTLQAPPTPAELAAKLNVSVRQLYRQFELDGDSIGRYIQRQRLHCAARDLAQGADTGLPITTIAYKWGFTDSAHFSRVFKRHFGMPPKDYRAQSQKAADAQR